MTGDLIQADIGQRRFSIGRTFMDADVDAIGERLWEENKFAFKVTQSKEALFESFHKGMQSLVKTDDSVGKLLRAISQAGGFASPRRPALPSTRGTSLFQLAEQPVAKLGPELLRAIDERCKSIPHNFVEALTEMVQMNHVGLIRFSESDPEVAQFYYSRYTTRGTSHRVGNIRYHKEVDYLTGYLHDLVSAKSVPVKWFNGIIPKRVQPVIDALPPDIEARARIVTGKQIAETIVAREVAVREWEEVIPETPSYADDPALVFGCFVLAGWEEGER